HFFFLSAEGLWTAFLPDLSLRTSYCGSSSEAATVRPAASVRSVIFFSTLPVVSLPWLLQATSSPSWRSFSRSSPLPIPGLLRVAVGSVPPWWQGGPRASRGGHGSGPARAGRPGSAVRADQTRSNRSRFMTLSHALTKSWTNFSLASSLA